MDFRSVVISCCSEYDWGDRGHQDCNKVKIMQATFKCNGITLLTKQPCMTILTNLSPAHFCLQFQNDFFSLLTYGYCSQET